MKAVVGLLLLVLRISHGVETHCDGRLDGAQCYGALGGTVVLQLMDDASEIPRYFLFKGEQQILFGKKNKMIVNTMESRSVFIPSKGTFLINNLKRTDGGKYSLKLQDSDGDQTGTLSLQLFIQAPVSSVLLRSECLSEGQKKVSCSSEGGDSPQYSWTLDGRTLTDTELLSGTKETNIIILKQNILGRLVCSVRNKISLSSNEKNITSCVVETHCDGRLDGAQCYGALGGTVVLQLMDDASEIPRYNLLKGKQQILFGRKNNIIYNTMENRSVFIPSKGTFLINNLMRTDGGKYSLKLQDSDERQIGKLSLQLFIQAPVSSVLLRSECLSEGQMKVSCSSEGGDSPQYSWTLDGRTLTDTELLSGTKETNIIILKQNILGRLVCSVRNKISLSSNEKNITSCGVETHCDGRLDGAQCYGVLGGTVVLQLMDDASKIPSYDWVKEGTIILKGRKDKVLVNSMGNRSLFIPSNGTFLMNNLNSTDLGEYTLTLFDSDGQKTGTRTLQLSVEEPSQHGLIGLVSLVLLIAIFIYFKLKKTQ